MTTFQAENHQLPVKTDLPEGIFTGFHKAKDFLTQTVNTVTKSAEQAKESLTQTAGQNAVNTLTTATDKAVDTVKGTAFRQAKDSLTTTTYKAVDKVTAVTSDSVKTITATAEKARVSLEESIEQTKDSLEQTRQTAEQLRSTTSEVIQTAISSSVSDWLQAHPVILRLVQVLLWATNHPIVSLIILLFTIAIAWSLIKAIGRLVETSGWLLLQAPFKLIQILIRIGAQSLGNFGGLAVKELGSTKSGELPALQYSQSQQNHKDKQQRLVEISTRLEAIRKEQNELLQEATAILNSDSIDIKI